MSKGKDCNCPNCDCADRKKKIEEAKKKFANKKKALSENETVEKDWHKVG